MNDKADAAAGPLLSENRERLIVVSSFLLIFAFSSVDHAISPLVEILHSFYAVELQKVLWLISCCTFGIVIGVFMGPALIKSYDVVKIIGVSSSLVAASLALFLFIKGFNGALAIRFVFGVSAGVLSTTMWWVAYHGVSKKYYEAVITVLMAARPMAVALGVPLTGMAASVSGWKSAFWFFFVLIVLGAAVIMKSIGADKTVKTAPDRGGFAGEYAEAFSLPYAKTFYFALFINKMCYFGFYSLAGIWFIRHYGLGVFQITKALACIGLCEAGINFFIPSILRFFGHERAFTGSMALSCALFCVFVTGALPLKMAVAAFAFFVMLDRVYSMAVVIKLPEMFRDCRNKTVMGSLITLTAWTGLTLISWFEGRYLDSVGMGITEVVLFLLLASGCGLIYFVHRKTVFSRFPESCAVKTGSPDF